MTELTESPRNAGFILSLANGNRSLENGVLLSGENLEAGAVLGKITSSGKYVAIDPSATDGSEDPAGILYAATDATDGDVAIAVVAREAEVIGDELVWPDDISTGDQETALAALEGDLRIQVR